MKKLAVLMMIPAVTILLAAAMTSAQKDFNAIHGTYASTGMGNCLNSAAGFNANYTPVATAVLVSQLYTGTWTFEKDGWSGQFQGTLFGMAPSGAGSPNTFHTSFPFIYTLVDDVITVQIDESKFRSTNLTGSLAGLILTLKGYKPPIPTTSPIAQPLQFSGAMSVDHKALTLSMGNQIQAVIRLSDGAVLNYQICNVGHVLNRVQ
jgi:hypothetical protein